MSTFFQKVVLWGQELHDTLWFRGRVDLYSVRVWIVCATLRISLLGLQFPGQMESGCWVSQRFQDKSHQLVTFFRGQDRLLADS